MLRHRSIPLLVVAVVVFAGLIAARGESDPKFSTVTIGTAGTGRPLPSGFVGLSLEYEAVPQYAGTDPAAINPVFERLIRDLNPGQAPELRIGGNSTNRTWWPVPGMARPGGVRYALTPSWTSVTAALTRDLGAHLILGINMEANSLPLARQEANQLLQRIGSPPIRALEPGNEPELYGNFAWYRRNDVAFHARPRNYSPADFGREFAGFAAQIPYIPLAGPATGQPRWSAYTPKLLEAQPRLGLVTLHRYATRGCFTHPASPQYHTIKNLLTPYATEGLAATVSPYTRLPVRLRVDELNSVNCGGVYGVSDRFASALWALDTLFQLARIGVAGVNFHTFPGAKYAPFSFRRIDGRWEGAVKPMYYGMLMFAQAARPGSRFLPGSGRVSEGFDVWALRAPDHKIRTVLVNYGSQPQTLALRLVGRGGAATIERLLATSPWAAHGVTIGGRSFSARTSTGALTGSGNATVISPKDGTYTVDVPAASAALLTTSG